MRWSVLLTLGFVCNASLANEDSVSGCQTQVLLRDKWRFLHQGRRPYIRIRRKSLIFRNGPIRVRFSCVQNIGNIYLIRKSNYKPGQDAVLCVGFSYVADHPYAEYSAIRLMTEGIGSHIMSPQLFPHGTEVSINTTCDFVGPEERQQYAFIHRATPGCKFPKKLNKSWNFTYLHARRLVIDGNNMTLILLNGRSIVFSCYARDSNYYVVRSSGYPTADKDSYMCVSFVPIRDNPFYSYVFSRLNSGSILDRMLKTIPKGQRVHLHQDCDWMDSPARPEFLYE
ncbi:hypothetical protein C0Q70_05254 [Pomacea canaliculata]|uniref:ZP domain-containing protein n=1 Tax=Pomacea canaliculata TaxID=400727 RepID=A0A2T7PKR7_POMCA|nr:uncharacterized protein LOC112560006 isoform X2 [Pomacea canaliculata]PVD33992.1 hypothetical protein C0Q70_05254 [Pomacea canaliculata]